MKNPFVFSYPARPSTSAPVQTAPQEDSATKPFKQMTLGYRYTPPPIEQIDRSLLLECQVTKRWFQEFFSGPLPTGCS